MLAADPQAKGAGRRADAGAHCSTLRLAQPALLVDITRIPELAAVSEDADAVTIGATVTHAAVEDGRVTDPTGGFLARVARGIAYRAVRKPRHHRRAASRTQTQQLTGSPVLSALGADVIIAGAGGTRRVRLPGFVHGALETELAVDEAAHRRAHPKILARCTLRLPTKICRKTGEFADAIGVAVHDPDQRLTRLAASTGAGPPVVIAPPDLQLDRGRLPVTADLQQRLVQAGLAGDAYDLRLHAVAVRRAIATGVGAMTRITLTVNGRGQSRPKSLRARTSPISCASSSSSPARTSAASTASAARAPWRSTARSPAPVSPTPWPATARACAPSKASTTTRRWRACARPSPRRTRCSAAIARPAC